MSKCDSFISKLDKTWTLRNYNKNKLINYSIENINDMIKKTNKLYNIDFVNKNNIIKLNNQDINRFSIENKNIINKDKNNINKDTKKENIIIKPKSQINVIIENEIKNLYELIKLIELYPLDDQIEYNIDIKILHKIKDPLIELNNMIGMHNLKINILDQILFYIQKLQSDKIDFLHTVIYGSPGTGKTDVAKIIGTIFTNLGVLQKGTFKKVTRSDLIAGYLGQTAIKTHDVIKECVGGVLFIDEAYALGNNEKKDSYSKECIDTLCEALSDHKHDLMVIIAGYQQELEECFFNYNKGLDSRFPWRFKIDDYTHDDLYNIFVKKIKDIEWKIDEKNTINSEWFKKNKDYFPFYGRDIENLLTKIKIAHSRRIFGKSNLLKKCITMDDIENGFKIYLKNENLTKIKNANELKKSFSSMYI